MKGQKKYTFVRYKYFFCTLSNYQQLRLQSLLCVKYLLKAGAKEYAMNYFIILLTTLKFYFNGRNDAGPFTKVSSIS